MKYPELDKPARLAVWKRFLAMAGQKIHEGPAPAGVLAIEESDLDALSEKPFNGMFISLMIVWEWYPLTGVRRSNGQELGSDGSGAGAFDVSISPNL